MDIASDMSEYLKYVGGTPGLVTLGAVAAAGMYYLSSRPQPFTDIEYLDMQSVEVPGVPHARASVYCKGGQLVEYLDEEVRTVYDAFRKGSQLSSNGQCLGWRPGPHRPYQWIVYNDVLLRGARVGAGLVYKGFSPGNNTRAGIYSQNRPEYVIAEMGCHSYSMVPVPLYDTLGPDACSYIINQAEIGVVFCDKNTKVELLLKHRHETPDLKLIVLYEAPSSVNLQAARECGVELMSLQDLEELGDAHPRGLKLPGPDDLYVICYTSGTTGNPKGAMLTQKSLIATACALQVVLSSIEVTYEDILMSYLPLAHVYERVVEVLFFMNGAQIGYYSGDVKMLMDDIKALRPTIFPSVPRLLNRIYDKVMDTVNGSALKKMIFNQGICSKKAELERGVIRSDSVWDRLAFKKIQQSLGGRCKLISCGSAPLSGRVMDFMRCSAGCPVVEGYGQTENTAVASLQLVGDCEAGNVGPPLPCNWIKLADVPDMGYYADNNQGEICIKGPNVFIGYLKQPEKTAQTLDADGWLHTGDIGKWLPNGALKIVDRKKHIFKLAQGEYIAPEKIENVYLRSPAISQMFVHGDSYKASLVGIVVPDPEVIQKWVHTKLGLNGSTVEQLCANEAVKKAVFQDIVSTGKRAGLHSFEQVKDIYLFPDQFSVENGLLTPTFKSKRDTLRKYFSAKIDEMYSKLS